MLMGKRQKRRLNFNEKAAEAPQFFFSDEIKVGNPKRAKWAYLFYSASQSALRIRFILLTGVAYRE